MALKLYSCLGVLVVQLFALFPDICSLERSSNPQLGDAESLQVELEGDREEGQDRDVASDHND